MSFTFNLNTLGKHFNRLIFSSNNMLEELKRDEHFMKLYHNIENLESLHDIDPLITIPLLDKLQVKEDLLYRLFNCWMKDEENKNLTYLMFKKYPNLMAKIEKFDFPKCMYIKELVKILSDINNKSDVYVDIYIKWEKDESEEGWDEPFNWIDTPEKVIFNMIYDYDLSLLCEITSLEIDGTCAMKTIPFCYFAYNHK